MTATPVILHLHPLSSRRRTLCHSSSINGDIPSSSDLALRRCRTTTPFVHLEKGRNSTLEARAWGPNPRRGMVMGDYDDDDDIDEDDDEDEDEDEDEDSSLDLLIRFVENVFKKVSRKARKAVKSVLPVPISSKLVGFAVNGTLILTFLWVLKAFLEVICTLGSVVFTSILLIRGIWAGISYFQENRIYRADDDEPKSWSGSMPAI